MNKLTRMFPGTLHRWLLPDWLRRGRILRLRAKVGRDLLQTLHMYNYLGTDYSRYENKRECDNLQFLLEGQGRVIVTFPGFIFEDN